MKEFNELLRKIAEEDLYIVKPKEDVKITAVPAP